MEEEPQKGLLEAGPSWLLGVDLLGRMAVLLLGLLVDPEVVAVGGDGDPWRGRSREERRVIRQTGRQAKQKQKIPFPYTLFTHMHTDRTAFCSTKHRGADGLHTAKVNSRSKGFSAIGRVQDRAHRASISESSVRLLFHSTDSATRSHIQPHFIDSTLEIKEKVFQRKGSLSPDQLI